ncbi:MAG: hypothetical protein GEU88_05765 [Solirubrobacterales bacterium]|nr:hypothetical protein [Solirubrobacterales bacterium]
MIDVPIESLPFVDELSTEVAATTQRTWDAVLATVRATGEGRRAQATARALGSLADRRSGEIGRIGSTIPGFVVARSVPPAVLALMGEHRYSRYALVFRIAEQGPDRPLLVSAETRAEFPGRAGSVYRLLVIGSRGHQVVTRSLLRSIRRRAERG